ncbi:MAG: NAD(P)/FAD-dependent oxidoreductase [Thermomicrobiales bacterium]
MSTDAERVVIVGAGLAGLSCGLHLAAEGIPFSIFEAADQVGGRVRTDEVRGFRLDRGFQVLLTAYPEAAELLDYGDLDLHPFYPGAFVRTGGRFHVLADPFRNPVDGGKTIATPVGSILDKGRVAQLRYRVGSGTLDDLWKHPETTSLNYLRQAGFSTSMIDGFFRPFFGGVFLEPDLRTSSRMLEFIFRMFAQGDSAIPATGMEAIPRQLAARLPEGSIYLNTPVESIESSGVRLANGETAAARAVVVATGPGPAHELLPGITVPGTFGTACLYYSADNPPVREPALLLDSELTGPVNNAVVISNVSPLYAPPGAALISASTVGIPDVDDPELDRRVRDQLTGWFARV